MSSTKTNPHSSARVIAYDDIDGIPTRVTEEIGLPTQSTVIQLPVEDVDRILSALGTICNELSDIKEHLSVITGLEN